MESALEQFLARSWQEILGLDRVGAHDNFFELGGDSLRGAIVLNRLQQELGEVVSMATIFDVPTVAGLAAHLSRLYPDAVAHLARAQPVDDSDGGAEIDGGDGYAPVERTKEAARPSGAQARGQASRRPSLHHELGIDLEEVEAALLEEHGVEDCRVLARETESGDTVLVAYILASGALSPERLREHLRATLADSVIPSVYVPVSALPLTETGQIDEPALCRLAVIDDLLMRRWEEHLGSLAGVDEVELVAEDRALRLPSVHLHDLLPERAPAASAAVPVASRGDAGASEALDRPMALAPGGRLIVPDDAPKTLTEGLLRSATEHADKGITYVRSDGSEMFESYAALLDRARRILGGLQDRGLRPGDRAIVQVDELEDHYAAFWACVLGGIAPVTVAVPLTYGEHNAVVDKLYDAWELLGHPPVVTSPQLVEPVAGLRRLLPMDGLTVLSVGELGENPPTGLIHHSEPDDLAFLQLTSGSTGVPKCIQEVHRSVVAHVHSVREFDGHTSDDVTLNWMPIDHVGALIMYHIKDTYLGCQQVHVKTDLILANPLKWLDLLEAHGVNYTWAPNFAYKLLADQLVTVTERGWDLSRMRFFMNAGEQVTLPVAEDFLKRLAPFGVGEGAMQPGYGGAETCTRITCNNQFNVNTGVRRFLKSSLNGRLEEADGDDSTTAAFVDLGPPIPGVRLRIVDRDGRLLPEGVIGRLDIDGPVVTPGYLDNDAANREAFAQDGWLTLGDLGFIFDGRLSLTGREKETIIVRGANLYCHEIEDVVNAIEGVEPTFVGACAVADPTTGTEGFAVFFVPKASVGEDAVELVRAIRARVAASLGAAPTHVVPVAAGDFPKTTSGKIQRAKLKQALEDGEFQDALKALDVALSNPNTVPDWFYRRTWRRRAKPSGHPRRSGGKKTVVLLDKAGLGAALAERENHYGRPWVEVETGPAFEKLDEDRYRIDPGSRTDYRRLLAGVAADGIGVEEVVHLWTYSANPGEIADANSLEAAQERGACSLLFLLQALAADHPSDQQPVRVTVASSHAQPVLPTDSVASEQGPLLGLLRTAPKEWPWLECHHVDLSADDLEADADAVLRELRAVRADEEVAYRDGHRWVPRLEHVDLRREQARPLPFERGGLYLVTGGLGGVAGQIARHLLEEYDAKLLLVGRTALPEPRAWATDAHSKTSAGGLAAYRALEQLGGEVLYRSADVADASRLHAVVGEAETRWGRALDGIVHLAGTYEERRLAEETRESFMGSLRPKLQGTWVLHELTRDRPDCAFITSSSVNGLLGGFGTGAYAAANSFLDGFAHHRRQIGLPSACFAWSLWDAVGMAGDFPLEKQKLARARGFLPIAPEQGLNSLLAGLHRDPVHLLVGFDASRPHVGRHVDQPAEGTRALRAYYTTRNGPVSTALHEGQLDVRDRFGTPSACELVPVPELLRTEAGAVDRSRLGDAGRSTATDPVRIGSRASFAEPRTPAEAELAGIWAEVLKLDQVGVEDDFVELGGSSLLAAQVMRRLKGQCGVELPVRTIFDRPTVAGLALAVTRTAAEAQAFPLSPGQRDLWSYEQREAGHASPHGTPALRLRGPLDVAALEASLEEICVRHEALRTTFGTRHGEPVQRVRPPGSIALPRVDLRELPPPARETEAARLLAREAQRPFDLSRDPMLRAMLVRLDDDEHVLLFVIHHLACDGWSLDILVRELQALYGAVRSGQRANLPELRVQYADYVVWQRERLHEGALRQSVEYWKKQLARPPKALDIPRDRRGPPAGASGRRLRGAWQELNLSATLVGELQALCRQRSTSSFTALLAAWATVLSRYSGQDDILIYTPFANRQRAEVEGLIGFFATNLVLRHRLGGDPSFGELLARVHATVLDAFSHDELPYAELPEDVRPTPQVSFFLRNVPQDDMKMDGLEVERIDFEIDRGEKSGFLSLVMREGKEGLTARLFYNPDLFEAATATGMLRYLRTVLEGVVADPERKVFELPLPVRPVQPVPIQLAHPLAEGTQPRRLGHVARRGRKWLGRAVRRARRELGRPALRARRASARARAKL